MEQLPPSTLRPVKLQHLTPRITLKKGPKLEIFGSRVLLHKSYLYGLATRQKKFKILMVLACKSPFVLLSAVADIAKNF